MRLIFSLLYLFIPCVWSKMFKPKNSIEFQEVLNKTRAGDVIELLPIEYTGEFLVSKSSDIPDIPITIRGTSVNGKTTTLTNLNGTVFNVTASHNIFRTIWCVKSQTCMVLSGAENELDGLSFKDSKEGIIALGDKIKMAALTFSNVDIGIAVKASHLTLLHSSITSGNISMEIERDTCCNVIDNNVFNGYVNMRGNGNKFNSNVVTGGMLVTGCYNEFKSNVIQQLKLTKKCDNPDKGLNIFNKSPDQDFA